MGIEEAENIKEVTFEIFVEMVKQMRVLNVGIVINVLTHSQIK